MRRKFLLSVFLVIILIVQFTLLAVYVPHISLSIGWLLPFPAFMLVLLLFSPLGGVLLGQVTSYSLLQWLLRVWLSQILIAALGLATLVTIFYGAPSFLEGELAFSDLLTRVGEYSIWPWPGFPFVPVVVWGLSLAYFTYVKERPPFHHNHGAQLYQGQSAAFGKAYVEMLVQVPTQIGLMLAFAVAIIGLQLAAHWLLNWPLYSRSPILVSILLFLLFLIFRSALIKKGIRHLARFPLDLRHLGFFAIFTLTPLLIGIGFMSDQMLRYQPSTWLKLLPETATQDRLMFLYWGWWLICTPFVSSYYAAISKGRQIRTFVVGILLCPMVCLAVLKQWGSLLYHWPFWANYRGELVLILSVLLLILLMAITAKRRDTRIIAQGLMPAAPNLAAGRLSLEYSSKIYGISHYATTFFLGIAVLLFFQSVGGWYFIGLLFAIFAPCIIIKTCSISLMLGYQLLKDFRVHNASSH
ncbi:MAG: BCCT family transporter [Gammaproteobacteria bacterium]